MNDEETLLLLIDLLLQNALSEELSNMKKLQDDLLANKVTVLLGLILSRHAAPPFSNSLFDF